MKEFMLFIRKQNDSRDMLAREEHQKFLRECENYISGLKKEGKLISAQPIERKGNIISSAGSSLKESPYNEAREVIGGYYHILAKDLEEAIAIAKANPEFKFNPETRIEVRPIKIKEESTGYVYPTK